MSHTRIAAVMVIIELKWFCVTKTMTVTWLQRKVKKPDYNTLPVPLTVQYDCGARQMRQKLVSMSRFPLPKGITLINSPLRPMLFIIQVSRCPMELEVAKQMISLLTTVATVESRHTACDTTAKNALFGLHD